MAKQMRRVEKRYVPQQESYRSLPALSPQASPVDVTPSVAPVDASAEKLRQLAEGLSSLNKGLGDFLRMEKSFEETNRLANRTNAILGLPPVPGSGHMDVGVKEGYSEGQGMADSILLVDELEKAVAENDYFIDVKDPEGSIVNLQSFIQQKVTENLGDKAHDRAYMEGVSKEVVKFKVKAVAEAAGLIGERKTQMALNNGSVVAGRRLDSIPLEAWKDPAALRGIMGNTLGELGHMGLSKTAGASLMLQVATNKLSTAANEAHDMGDLESMKEAMGKLMALEMAVVTPDGAGQPLGGSFKVDKDGSVTAVLSPEMSDIRTERGKLATKLENLHKDTRDKLVAEGQAQIFEDLSNGVSRETVVAKLEPIKKADSKAYVEILDYMQKVNSSGAAILDDELRESLELSGDYDIKTIGNLVATNKLSAKSGNYLLSMKSKELAFQNQMLYQKNRIDASNNVAKREQREQVKQQNAAVLAQALTEMVNLEEAAVTRVNTYATAKSSAGEPVDLEMLKSMATAVDIKIKNNKEKAKEVTAASKEKTNEVKSKMTTLETLLPNLSHSQRQVANSLIKKGITEENIIDRYNKAKDAASKFTMTPYEQKQLTDKLTPLPLRRKLEKKQELYDLEFIIHDPLAPEDAKAIARRKKASYAN